jgi:hypothetical protein
MQSGHDALRKTSGSGKRDRLTLPPEIAQRTPTTSLENGIKLEDV